MIDEPTPCFGMSHLFDATDAESHRQAKSLCETCPFIEACKKNLLDARRNQLVPGPYGGPEGTWAGLLLKPRSAA